MSVRSLKLSVAACAVAAAVCTSAFAADSDGWYVGAGVGYAQNKLDGTALPIGSSEKTSDTGFKIYGGYQFTPNWAIETEYIDFGKYKFDYKSDVEIHGNAKTTGLGISAVGVLPLSTQLTLLGKLGVLAKKVKADLHYQEEGLYARDSQDKTKASGLLGVGAEYRFTQNFALRGEYEYAGKTKIVDGMKIENSLFSISARYSF